MHWDGSAWCFAKPASSLDYVGAIWGASTSDVWATASGAVLHFDGTSWSVSLPASGQFSLRGLHGTGPDDVWVTGTDEGAPAFVSEVVHWDGTAWSTVPLPTMLASYELGPVWASATDDVWVGTGYGAASAPMLHWDGTSWSSIVVPGANGFSALWGSATDDVWAVGDGMMWSSLFHWDGSAWSVATPTSSYVVSITGSGAGDVSAVGTDGFGNASQLLHWDGASWTDAPLPDPTVDPSIATLWQAPASSGDLWAVGQGGVMAERTSGTWGSRSQGPTGNLTGVWAGSATDAWAVGAVHATGGGIGAAQILRWDGSVWAESSLPASLPVMELVAVWGSGPDDIWAGGNSVDDVMTMLHWPGDSDAWNVVPTPPGFYLAALGGTGPADAWAVGDTATGGGIMHWDGTSWTTTFSLPSGDNGSGLLSVWASSASDAWAVGIAGAVVHWNGTTWTVVPTPVTSEPITNLEGVWASAPGDVWIVDQNGDVWRGNAELGWKAIAAPIRGGDGDFGIWGSGASDVWVIGGEPGGSLDAVVHWDGTSFTTSNAGAESYSAVRGAAGAGVWLVGPGGEILHHG
jgi:hypothetical protein